MNPDDGFSVSNGERSPGQKGAAGSYTLDNSWSDINAAAAEPQPMDPVHSVPCGYARVEHTGAADMEMEMEMEDEVQAPTDSNVVADAAVVEPNGHTIAVSTEDVNSQQEGQREYGDYHNYCYGDDGYLYFQDKNDAWFYQGEDGYSYPWSGGDGSAPVLKGDKAAPPDPNQTAAVAVPTPTETTAAEPAAAVVASKPISYNQPQSATAIPAGGMAATATPAYDWSQYYAAYPPPVAATGYSYGYPPPFAAPPFGGYPPYYGAGNGTLPPYASSSKRPTKIRPEDIDLPSEPPPDWTKIGSSRPEPPRPVSGAELLEDKKQATKSLVLKQLKAVKNSMLPKRDEQNASNDAKDENSVGKALGSSAATVSAGSATRVSRFDKPGAVDVFADVPPLPDVSVSKPAAQEQKSLGSLNMPSRLASFSVPSVASAESIPDVPDARKEATQQGMSGEDREKKRSSSRDRRRGSPQRDRRKSRSRSRSPARRRSRSRSPDRRRRYSRSPSPRRRGSRSDDRRYNDRDRFRDRDNRGYGRNRRDGGGRWDSRDDRVSRRESSPRDRRQERNRSGRSRDKDQRSVSPKKEGNTHPPEATVPDKPEEPEPVVEAIALPLVTSEPTALPPVPTQSAEELQPGFRRNAWKSSFFEAVPEDYSILNVSNETVLWPAKNVVKTHTEPVLNYSSNPIHFESFRDYKAIFDEVGYARMREKAAMILAASSTEATLEEAQLPRRDAPIAKDAFGLDHTQYKAISSSEEDIPSDDGVAVKPVQLPALAITQPKIPKPAESDELAKLRNEALMSMERAKQMLAQVEALSAAADGVKKRKRGDSEVEPLVKKTKAKKRKPSRKQRDSDEDDSSDAESSEPAKKKRRSRRKKAASKRTQKKKNRSKKARKTKKHKDSSESESDSDSDSSEKKKKHKGQKKPHFVKEKEDESKDDFYVPEEPMEESELSEASVELPKDKKAKDKRKLKKKKRTAEMSGVTASIKRRDRRSSSSTDSQDDGSARLQPNASGSQGRSARFVQHAAADSSKRSGEDQWQSSGGRHQHKQQTHSRLDSEPNIDQVTSGGQEKLEQAQPAGWVPRKHQIDFTSDNPLLRNAEYYRIVDPHAFRVANDLADDQSKKIRSAKQRKLRSDDVGGDVATEPPMVPAPSTKQQVVYESRGREPYRSSQESSVLIPEMDISDSDSEKARQQRLSVEQQKRVSTRKSESEIEAERSEEHKMDKLRQMERETRVLNLPATDDRVRYVKDYLDHMGGTTASVGETKPGDPIDIFADMSTLDTNAGVKRVSNTSQQPATALTSEYEMFESELFTRDDDHGAQKSSTLVKQGCVSAENARRSDAAALIADASTALAAHTTTDKKMLKQLEQQTAANMLSVISQLKTALAQTESQLQKSAKEAIAPPASVTKHGDGRAGVGVDDSKREHDHSREHKQRHHHHRHHKRNKEKRDKKDDALDESGLPTLPDIPLPPECYRGSSSSQDPPPPPPPKHVSQKPRRTSPPPPPPPKNSDPVALQGGNAHAQHYFVTVATYRPLANSNVSVAKDTRR